MEKLIIYYKMPYYSLLLRFRNEEDIDYYIMTGYYWFNLLLMFNILSIYNVILAFNDVPKPNLLVLIGIYSFFALINYFLFLKKGQKKLMASIYEQRSKILPLKFSIYYFLISFFLIVLSSIMNNPEVNRLLNNMI